MTAGIDEVLGADAGQQDPFGTGSLASAQYEPFSFTVKRLVLASLVDKAISVVPNRDVMPVLRHFLVQVAPGRLQFAATDLELSVLATSPAVTAESEQLLVLPARKLLAILREVTADDITIDVAGEFAKVRAGTASWSLRLDDAGDYPALPDPAEVEMHPVGRAAFLAALKMVRHAAGKDSGRPSLMQVDIKPSAAAGSTSVTVAAQVTACDSVRFARTALPGFPIAMQIPSGALDGLVKMLEGTELDEVHVGETEKHLVFRAGSNVFLASRLMQKFPDVDKLLLRPALENKLLLTADKGELEAAIRKVRIAADPETSAVGLQIAKGTVTAVARDKFGNRAEETVAAGWDGPERLVVVNHQFLLEMLAAYPAGSCRFFLGPEAGKKKSVLRLHDEDTGTVGIIYQMLAALVGYDEGQ